METETYAPAPIYNELLPEQLRWTCPESLIEAETTEGITPIEGIIGQDRAIDAIKLGVELFSPGYNIFVCGLAGTGKATTIKSILESIQPNTSPVRDFCYVNNFRDPDQPILLTFEQGVGCHFHREMDEAIDLVQQRIPGLFEEQDFIRQKQELIDEYNSRQTALFGEFEERISHEGFILARIQEGQVVHPEIAFKIGDKALRIPDLPVAVEQQMITREQADAVTERFKVYRDQLQEVMRTGIALTRDYQKRIANYERERASSVLEAIFAEVFVAFNDPKVHEYLNDLIENILDNLDTFSSSGQEGEVPDLTEYEVNLMLDNKNTKTFPVIIETAPNYMNIFGTMERQLSSQGMWYTDFTKIKAGALLRADGGYLVLNAADALTEPGVWRTLKRVLLYRKLEIQSIEAASQLVNSAIKPEAIDINVKVILIGNNEIYSMLAEYERDFKKIFKVKADFDYETPNTPEAVQQYAALLNKLIVEENMKHFDKSAICAIVEYGARLSDSQKKLTTQFSEIADVVREANYWCNQNNHPYIQKSDVTKALEKLRERHSLYEEKMQTLIEEEIILIDVEGRRTGQINGLAVYGGERFSFGKPSRITATVSAGTSGIINIEREAKMSGKTHDKGVLILSGYLRELFATKKPLALTASVSFEQSYSGVDGDSATAAEMYALLSSISGIPIKQQYAVTGSMNQKGDIQPIGGLNEKIEGFFDVCVSRGLTGNQGVIIPKSNMSDLMLKEAVVDAVREGKFHIYPIERIEQGIEILTGVRAGMLTERGVYEKNTLFAKVAQRLEELSAATKAIKGKVPKVKKPKSK